MVSAGTTKPIRFRSPHMARGDRGRGQPPPYGGLPTADLLRHPTRLKNEGRIASEVLPATPRGLLVGAVTYPVRLPIVQAGGLEGTSESPPPPPAPHLSASSKACASRAAWV